MAQNQSTSKSRGIFLTFEGGEGAGKSTQVKALAARLEAHNISVVLTREPGGAVGAEEIRNLLVNGSVDRWSPLSEALLNFAARQEHLVHTIRPAIDAGQWVICDRFSDSTMAYQGYAGGVGRPAIEMLNSLVVGAQQPDLTLIFDLPPEEGLARAQARGEQENRFEQKGLAYHQSLREAFLDITKREPDRCVLIDARPGPDEVAEAVWHVVARRFSLEGAAL